MIENIAKMKYVVFIIFVLIAMTMAEEEVDVEHMFLNITL